MAEKTIAQLEAELKLVQDKLIVDTESVKLLEKQFSLQSLIIEAQQKEIALEIQKLEKKKQSGQFDQTEQAYLDTRIRKLNELARDAAELADKEEERLAKLKQINEELAKQQATAKRLAKLLGLDKDDQDSLFYQLLKNPKAILGEVGKQIKEAGGVGEIAFAKMASQAEKAVGVLFNLTKEQMLLADSSVASFVAATGASQEYANSIYEVGRGSTALGIGFAEASKANIALYENLNTFTTLNKTTRESIATTAAGLERLGISSADTGQTIQSLSLVMGISEEQAAETTKTLAAMGPAMGVSAKRMISDFMQVKDQLSVFGDSMDDVFIKLQAQAKATGVSVSDLLNITNKFDTFEGAATQVAKLNAILGGPFLSSMAMIENVDPSERIDMLRQAVNQANVSFENMSYYEKKAIMDAGGFKSVDEMQRVLSMSAGAYAEELSKQAAKTQELEETMARALPIQEKMNLIMANFAIVMEPVITGISDFLTIILKMQDEGETTQIVLTGIGIALGLLALYLLGVAANAYIAGISFAAGMAAVTPAATAAAPALLALGTAGSVSIPVLLSIAAIGLVLAASLYAVGYVIKELLSGLSTLFATIAQSPSIFESLAIGIGVLALALYGLSNPLTLLGVATLLATMYGLADAINSMETDKIFNFKVIMEKVVEVSNPDVIDNFEKFTQKFDLVAKATNEVNVDNSQALTQMLTATQNIPQNLKLNQNQTIFVKIGDKQIKGIVEKVVDNSFADTNVYGAG